MKYEWVHDAYTDENGRMISGWVVTEGIFPPMFEMAADERKEAENKAERARLEALAEWSKYKNEPDIPLDKINGINV